MDSTRWQQIQALFHHALELPESMRLSYLASASRDDTDMASEVIAMLREDSSQTSLLNRGLLEIAYQMLDFSSVAVTAQEFGPYRLKRILGEGGMGVVWLAERQDAGNEVAIKFLPHAGLSPARRDRFTHEIKTLAKLSHPFIARLYDAGTLADGTPWFVMEFVEGPRLTEHCDKQQLSIDNRLKLFRSVCQAVQYAHSQEIIHRDLKPSNIFVDATGAPRLLDFGIAKELQSLDDPTGQTGPGLRMMSYDYAAPEWKRDGNVGFYTDVYSLGVILYELLTGQLPVRHDSNTVLNNDSPAIETPSALARKSRRTDAALSKSAWNDLDVLCLKALHTDPSHRYSSVEALIRDLDHYLRREPLEAQPDSLRYRTAKFILRNRSAVVASSLLVVFVVVLVTFFTIRLARARNTALAEAARTARIQQFMLNLFQGDDKDAGPSQDLRVVALIDRGVREAQSLNREPAVQADLYQTLGTMYQKLGHPDRAVELLELSVKERQSLPGKQNSEMVGNLISLGLARSEQGKPQDGEKNIRDALALINSNDPHNTTLLARADFALGQVLVDSGKHEQAVWFLNRSIALESIADANSPELAETLATLADATIYLGHYSDADALDRNALVIERKVYGDHDPHVGALLSNLAETLSLRGQYAEAEQLNRQALQVSLDWYGTNHPQTASMLAHLGTTLMYEKKYPEARDLLQQALGIQDETYGKMSPRVAFVLNSLGAVSKQMGDFRATEAEFRRALEIYRVAYGEGDYRVAVAMSNVASVYLAENDYRRAEPLFRDAIQRFEKVLPADNINIAIGHIKLGRTLLGEQRYREAARHSRTGYDILIKQSSPSTIFVQYAREDLATAYDHLKQPQEALKFKLELASSITH
jgi:serine/threonine protein kinase/Tfp pilus assembly protein PilF